MNKIVCEKCGTEMIPIQSEHPYAMICPKCGWNWVTSEYNPMQDDITIYEIKVISSGNPTLDSIKKIAHITNLNSMQIKKAISNPPAVIFSGTAEQISEISKILKVEDIQHMITPDFPW